VDGGGNARQRSGGDAAVAVEGAVEPVVHHSFYPDEITLVNNIRVK
jgi:hypothetical protein